MMISDLNIKVDRDLCITCGVCVERCIMDNLRLFVPPCQAACPIHMNCQGYVRLIAQGKEEKAAQEMRKYLPFAGILGRVCHHPCEQVCERNKIGDGAVHIRALKRYLADRYPEVAGALLPMKRENGKRVAIVGSGPSGLMAAHDLRVSGHQVAVFDESSEPGGLLRWAIPSFILPTEEVDKAICMLTNMGIEFFTGKRLGGNLDLKSLEKDYDAILLAIGLGESVSLTIPGIDQEGVLQGLTLLKRVKENNPPRLGDSVIVIGGGNSAVDCALTCMRLGAKDVRMVCLEDRDNMPAFDWELQVAQEEGIKLVNGLGPRRIVRTGTGKLSVETSRCVSLYDDKGVFCPTLEDEPNKEFEADSIVIAIGQKLKSNCLPADLLDGTKSIIVDPLTLQSPTHSKVFFSGAISGAGSVVEAMAQGREAAKSIARFVSGDGMRWGRDFWVENGYLKEYEAILERAKGGARMILERVPIKKRTLEKEVEMPLTPEQAKQEAERCMSCGRPAEVNKTCWMCLPCEIECPQEALQVRLPYQVR